MLDVRTIIPYDLKVDGHTVSRSHYNVDQVMKYIVEYKKSDIVSLENERCLSCWFKVNDPKNNAIKNITDGVKISKENGEYYIDASLGGKFKPEENVVVKRGSITIPGVVIDNNRIKVNGDLITKLNKKNKGWNNMPGFAITSDNLFNILNSDKFNICIKGGSMVSIATEEEESLIPMTETISPDNWYGIVINFGDTFSAYLFTDIDGKLTQISSTSGIDNEIYENIEIEKYYIKPSNGSITNIRLYDSFNNEIDKQLTDLVSYNIRNDHNAIINDSADIYLNTEYIGRQR
jgi:hypothetical protein